MPIHPLQKFIQWISNVYYYSVVGGHDGHFKECVCSEVSRFMNETSVDSFLIVNSQYSYSQNKFHWRSLTINLSLDHCYNFSKLIVLKETLMYVLYPRWKVLVIPGVSWQAFSWPICSSVGNNRTPTDFRRFVHLPIVLGDWLSIQICQMHNCQYI